MDSGFGSPMGGFSPAPPTSAPPSFSSPRNDMGGFGQQDMYGGNSFSNSGMGSGQW
jgi:hypothetical protein